MTAVACDQSRAVTDNVGFAGAMHPECEGMILASLDSLVQGDAAVDLFVKVCILANTCSLIP